MEIGIPLELTSDCFNRQLTLVTLVGHKEMLQ